MKRFLSLILAFSLAIGVFAAAPVAGFATDYNELVFTLNEDGESYSVKAENPQTISGDVVIPEEYNGLPVTEIADYAFKVSSEYEPTNVDTFTIPKTIKKIGVGAFGYCFGISGIYISDLSAWCKIEFAKNSFTERKGMWYVCDISNPLFFTSKLYINNKLVKNLIIPEGVTHISDEAFYYYSGAEQVTFPETLKSLGEGAFAACENIKTVLFYGTEEDWNSLDKSTRNPYITDAVVHFLQPIYDDYGTVFSLNPDKSDYTLYMHNPEANYSDYEIPSKLNNLPVTEIFDCAFQNANISSVIIPDSVTRIGSYAFVETKNLQAVVLPANLTEIEPYTFSESGLTKLTIPHGVRIINEKAFYNAPIETLTLPSTIISFENYSFGNNIIKSLYYNGTETQWNKIKPSTEILQYENTSFSTKEEYLGYLTLSENPDGSSYSIVDCDISASGSLILPETFNGFPITHIASRAFYKCNNLTEVVISESILSIEHYAFYSCSGIYDIVIPDSVTFLAARINYGNTLNSLTLGKNVTTIPNDNAKNLVLGEGISVIEPYRFEGCKNLETITIKGNNTLIGEYAFKNCTSLTSINLGDGGFSIGTDAFAGCTALTGVYVDNLENWLKIDFANTLANPLCFAKKLYVNGTLASKLVVPEGVTEIKPYSFYNFVYMTSVTLPDSLEKIGASAFYYCTNLATVNLGKGISAVANDAFKTCIKLKTVNYNAAEEDKAKITIGSNNEYLTNASWSCVTIQHNLGEWVIITNPTCTEGGLKEQSCLDCGEVINSKTLEALNHKYSETTLDSHPHSITKTCSRCGDTQSTSQYFTDCLECNFTVTAVDMSSYKVVSYIGSSGNVSIPETYNNCSVTSIGNGCFKNNSTIKSIEIPNSVTSIGSLAFMNCTALKSITVPRSVESIGSQAFYGFSGVVYCYGNSFAHSYAKENNLTYELIDGKITETENTSIDHDNLLIFTSINNCTDIVNMFGIPSLVEALPIASFVSGNLELYGTGTTVSVFCEGEYTGDYTVIVEGDLNGDSVCDALDALEAERASSGHSTPTTEEIYAANGQLSDTLDASSYQNVVNTALKN